ncbi:hypothetical protein FXO37_33760 [Capsicum annuum]|nr:hypothetical protein FXO37_33760 [Capsicum annuum]
MRLPGECCSVDHPWIAVARPQLGNVSTLLVVIFYTRADASTDRREFTSPMGRKYYYNKVTRTSKWRMPDEVKLDREKDTISHASDFGSISIFKTSSLGADGSLVSAHGAKSSPISVSPAANLPTIVASESSSLSGKVYSPMIETVAMKNSSEPASPAVADSEKIGIAVTLGNSIAPPVSETTTAQDAVVYGDGFSSENREASSQWRKVQDCLETDERCSHLEKIDRLEIFQEELRKAERKNHDEFRKLIEEHVAAGILNAKTNWRDYCMNIKDFAAYLAVSSNTSGSTTKDLFTDVMDELEKQVK